VAVASVVELIAHTRDKKVFQHFILVENWKIIIIIITEHLILRHKIQANTKAHAFLLPIMFSTEKDEFSALS